jgi:uncharacterized membrane protein
MEFFMAEYGRLVVFFHVLSAIIWVGGMIAIRIAVHPALQKLDPVTTKLSRMLEILKRFYLAVAPFTFLSLLTAVILGVGLGFKHGDPFLYSLMHVKEGIWTVMFINFVTMMVLRSKAEKFLKMGDVESCQKKLAIGAKYLLPLNILLGVIALYMGVMFRGF